MSENLKSQFQQMTNEELIDFALEHLGQENEAIRKAALQEHFLRIKDDPKENKISPLLDSNLTHNLPNSLPNVGKSRRNI